MVFNIFYVLRITLNKVSIRNFHLSLTFNQEIYGKPELELWQIPHE